MDNCPLRELELTAHPYGQYWTVSAVYKLDTPDTELTVDFVRFCRPDTIIRTPSDATSFFAANEELMNVLCNLADDGHMDAVETLLAEGGAPHLLAVRGQFDSQDSTVAELLNEELCIVVFYEGKLWCDSMISERELVTISLAEASVPFRIPFDKKALLLASITDKGNN